MRKMHKMRKSGYNRNVRNMRNQLSHHSRAGRAAAAAWAQYMMGEAPGRKGPTATARRLAGHSMSSPCWAAVCRGQGGYGRAARARLAVGWGVAHRAGGAGDGGKEAAGRRGHSMSGPGCRRCAGTVHAGRPAAAWAQCAPG
jgi:hypothetical protein